MYRKISQEKKKISKYLYGFGERIPVLENV